VDVSTYDESILIEIKKALGVAADNLAFDTDIRMYINGAFGTLNQLGLGPEGGFEVVDTDAVWADFVSTDLKLAPVKTYVYLRVRMIFDPPANSWATVAMKEQIEQLEWRLNMVREDQIPIEEVIDEDDDVFWYRYFRYLDGGTV
jgi:hypothetical protein